MINKKYSFGDFTDKSLVDEPVEDFNNSTIKGSCFYQQYFVDSEMFPAGMTGVTFENCNMDNVKIPDGNTIVGGCNNKVRVQNDGDDWILDSDLNPIEPAHKKKRLAEGRSIDPADIPDKYILEKNILKVDFNDEFAGGVPNSKSWFKVKPRILSTKTRKQLAHIKATEFDDMKASKKFGRFNPTPLDVSRKHKCDVGCVVIEGDVEYHAIEGECWKFKAKDGSMY